jgi:hypothetical protein
MESTEPFCLFECSLVRCATGRVCVNLRELLESIRTVPESVLEHHMMRCALEDHFELHEFPMIWPAGAGTRWATTCWENNSVWSILTCNPRPNRCARCW